MSLRIAQVYDLMCSTNRFVTWNIFSVSFLEAKAKRFLHSSNRTLDSSSWCLPQFSTSVSCFGSCETEALIPMTGRLSNSSVATFLIWCVSFFLSKLNRIYNSLIINFGSPGVSFASLFPTGIKLNMKPCVMDRHRWIRYSPFHSFSTSSAFLYLIKIGVNAFDNRSS